MKIIKYLKYLNKLIEKDIFFYFKEKKVQIYLVNQQKKIVFHY